MTTLRSRWAYTIAVLVGAVGWVTVSQVADRREAWDSELYFSWFSPVGSARRRWIGVLRPGTVVALGVRKGNPKAIRTWEDLAKPSVAVLYPSPKTSGGAMWDVIAIYGA